MRTCEVRLSGLRWVLVRTLWFDVVGHGVVMRGKVGLGRDTVVLSGWVPYGQVCCREVLRGLVGMLRYCTVRQGAAGLGVVWSGCFGMVW